MRESFRPFISQRVLLSIPYANERKLEDAVTKSNASSSSLSKEIVSSPFRRRAARRFVLKMNVNILIILSTLRKSYLETNNSKLSLSVRARWSFNPSLRGMFPFPLSCPLGNFAKLELELRSELLPLATASAINEASFKSNEPSMIESKSRGVGGERERHMSAILNRFLISALNTFWTLKHELGKYFERGEQREDLLKYYFRGNGFLGVTA